MLKVLFYSYYCFVLASFLVSFVTFKNRKTPLYLKLFCPFLGITVWVEAYSFYLVSQGHSNHIIYSIFNIVEFSFYLYVLSCIIINLKTRLAIRHISALNAFLARVDLLFVQKNTFTTFAFLLGSILIIFFSIYYFYELFRHPRPMRLLSEPAFWICLSLLFYYCCALPVSGIIHFWMNASQRLLNISFELNLAANILMYTAFAISFVCSVKIQKSTSTS